MEIVLKLLGSGYCIGFFFAFWIIGKKYWRGLRHSSLFWRSAPFEKFLTVAASFIMTFILSTAWMIVVCVYLGKMYLDDRKW